MATIVIESGNDLHISTSTNVQMKLNSSNEQINGTITYLDSSIVGCTANNVLLLQSTVSNNVFTTPLITSIGNYKICFDNVDIGQSITVQNRNITSLAGKSTRYLSTIVTGEHNTTDFVTITGASVSILLNNNANNNNIQVNDSVAIVLSTNKNCENAASNSVLISESDSNNNAIYIPSINYPL